MASSIISSAVSNIVRARAGVLVVICVSGATLLVLHGFCKYHKVHVNEISEFLAKKQQHTFLFYVFKACLLALTVAFAHGIRCLVSGRAV
jgi:hypothetical protein